MNARTSQRSTRADGGFTLAALMVAIMLMSIAMAVAVPSWTTWVQREKEAEAIFRGMQYAEAIRVFQQRHGRLPTTLEELVKVEPRSIRQLYPNPLNESGKWGLLIQSQQARGGNASQNQANQQNNQNNQNNASQAQALAPGAQSARPPSQGGVGAGANRRRGGGGGQVIAVPPASEEGDNGRLGGRLRLGQPIQRTTGPLVGVYPAADGQALRSFNGASGYNEWRFQTEIIPAPVIVGGDAAAPRVNSEWIGKPFRSDLQVQNQLQKQGRATGNAAAGQELGRGARSFRPGSRGNRDG